MVVNGICTKKSKEDQIILRDQLRARRDKTLQQLGLRAENLPRDVASLRKLLVANAALRSEKMPDKASQPGSPSQKQQGSLVVRTNQSTSMTTFTSTEKEK